MTGFVHQHRLIQILANLDVLLSMSSQLALRVDAYAKLALAITLRPWCPRYVLR
jgi:hypothetical protein